MGASGGTSGEGSLIIAVWKPAGYILMYATTLRTNARYRAAELDASDCGRD